MMKEIKFCIEFVKVKTADCRPIDLMLFLYFIFFSSFFLQVLEFFYQDYTSTRCLCGDSITFNVPTATSFVNENCTSEIPSVSEAAIRFLLKVVTLVVLETRCVSETERSSAMQYTCKGHGLTRKTSELLMRVCET